MITALSAFRDEAAAWCRGRNGWVRLPLLLAFVYYVAKKSIHPSCGNVLSPINLAFHESGHLLFSYFGRFFGVLGGSLLEFLMPFFLGIHFYRQREFFGIALCFGWLATVFSGMAVYVGDARAMALPLVTLFGAEPGVAHDWNYLLGKMGILRYDFAAAALIRVLGFMSLAVCLWTGGWMILRMIAPREAENT